MGTETSFNIGTPTVMQYYFITAYDFANNESTESNLSTFTPAGTPPPVTPPPGTPPPVAPPPVAPPAIGASPLSLSFGATQGGANPATQTVSISNTGGGTLSWSVSDNAPWLTLSRGLGTGNGVVTVSVVAGTTAIGTYNGSITISAIGASPVSVPMTFTVGTAPAPRLCAPVAIGIGIVDSSADEREKAKMVTPAKFRGGAVVL